MYPVSHHYDGNHTDDDVHDSNDGIDVYGCGLVCFSALLLVRVTRACFKGIILKDHLLASGDFKVSA